MPYCPKCDMEFVEGITACTDCGGPLYESEEAYKMMKKEEDLKRRSQEAAQMAAFQEMMEARSQDMESISADLSEISSNDRPETSAVLPGSSAAQAQELAKKSYVHPGVYVDAAQRYDDMKSSASAFYLVGGIAAVGSVLCWMSIIPLAMVAKIAMTAIAAGALVVAVKTTQSARAFLPQVAKEKERTESIIRWFLDTYTARDLDQILESASPSLSSEELSLKRYELIQDYLITNHDLPDPAYVDSLVEEIYGKLFD